MFLFGKTADINVLKKHSRILFGTDSALTADVNIYENIRTARKLDQLNDEELFHSVTKTAAEVWGIDTCGIISEGNRADIVVSLKPGRDAYESFYNTNPEDIIQIIKSGKIIPFDLKLKNVMMDKLKNFADFREFKIKKSVKFTEYDVTGILKQVNRYR